MDEQRGVHDTSIELGEIVYDSNLRAVGRVSGITDEGFEAETIDRDESELKERPGQEFGEGYLMWKCIECGEMDELEDGMPESCPSCGAPREAIFAIEED